MAEQASRGATPAGGEGQGAILIVEDDDRWRNMLSSLVERHLDGLAVETTDTVTKAIQLVEGHQYSCVICDYALDDGNGLSVLSAAREGDPDVPFVLVTGRGSERVASEAIREGVTDYIIKSQIDSRGEVLCNRVENAISEYRIKNRLRRERQLKSAITEIIGGSDGGDSNVFAEFCAQLVENTAYDCAWIATRDESGHVGPHAHAGMETYVGEVLRTGTLADSGEPTARALETDSFVEFPPPGESMETALEDRPDWLEVACECGVSRVLAVPIRYDGITHGALGVYATEPVATDDTRLLTEYADFVAFAFQTAQWKQSLLSEDPLRVEFLFEGAEIPYLEMTRELAAEAEIEIDSVVHRVDAPDRYLFAVEKADPEAVKAAATRVDGIEPVSLGEDRPRQEVAIAAETPERRLGQHGAGFERTDVADGTAVVTVSVPDRSDVAPLVATLEDAYGDVSVRMMKRSGDPASPPGTDPLESLTDKQRETLEYAFYAGFFDRPQGITAEEVADALGVSSSTVLYHLRTGERKLLGNVFTGL